MRERIQKILAAAGIASRRHAEAMLRAGRVTVNGRAARLGDRADPATDVVAVDGRRLARERPVYWLVHKPRGVLTTTRDPFGRRTILGLLPQGHHGRLFPVGRLDRDTEGLVLLTNDGAVTQALLHPSLGSEREYRVTVQGRLEQASQRRLAAGVELADGRTAPARVLGARFEAKRDATSFTLILTEGRKRQIRRSLRVLGHPVLRLRRTRMGPLRLGRVPPGGARPLTPSEVRALRAYARRRERARGAASGRRTPPRAGYAAGAQRARARGGKGSRKGRPELE